MNRSHSRLSRARKPSIVVMLVAMLALFAPIGMAFAQQPQTKPRAPVATQSMPAWEQLTPAQREALIATVRDRWNQNPQQRARMMGHAQRWQQMSPEQRQRAAKGKRRWDSMTPEQRAKARAKFEQGQQLSPTDRAALREKLKAMTPEQRREWIKQNRGTLQSSHRRDGQDPSRGQTPPAQEPRP